LAQAEVVVSAPAALVVSAGQLRKAYGKTIALAGVDLEVVRGTMHGLIGPDGAGKSTLMKIIAGVLQYDSGTVSVFGNDITSERTAEPVKSRLGLMPQGFPHFAIGRSRTCPAA
jgi:ABC-type multidrug transport system ATPase subunit